MFKNSVTATDKQNEIHLIRLNTGRYRYHIKTPFWDEVSEPVDTVDEILVELDQTVKAFASAGVTHAPELAEIVLKILSNWRK
jgi:hypothetical protein